MGHLAQQGEVAGEVYTLQWLHEGAKYNTLVNTKWIPIMYETTSKTNSEGHQNTASTT